MQTKIKPHTKQPQSPTHCPLWHTHTHIHSYQLSKTGLEHQHRRRVHQRSLMREPFVWGVSSLLLSRDLSSISHCALCYALNVPLSGFLCNLVSAASFIQRRLQIQLQLPASTTLMSDGDAQREGRRGGGKKHAANKLSVCERVYPSFPKPPAFLLPFFPTPF